MQYTKVFALNQKEIRERVPIIMINFLNLKNALANKDKDLSQDKQNEKTEDEEEDQEQEEPTKESIEKKKKEEQENQKAQKHEQTYQYMIRSAEQIIQIGEEMGNEKMIGDMNRLKILFEQNKKYHKNELDYVGMDGYLYFQQLNLFRQKLRTIQIYNKQFIQSEIGYIDRINYEIPFYDQIQEYFNEVENQNRFLQQRRKLAAKVITSRMKKVARPLQFLHSFKKHIESNLRDLMIRNKQYQ